MSEETSVSTDYLIDRHPSAATKLLVASLGSAILFGFYVVATWNPAGPKAVEEPVRAPAVWTPPRGLYRDPPAPAPLPQPQPVAVQEGPSILARALPATKAADPHREAYESPISGFEGGSQGQGEGRRPAAIAARAADEEETALGSALRTTKLDGAAASRLENPELTIVQGSRLPCIMETAFTSDAPGFVTCRIPTDVRGFDGTVTLLEAGTRIVGQSQGGLRQGQRRAFIVWTRATTPRGVQIDLDSPAADQLGRAGLDGDLNTHFFERFGNAILLSFLDTSLQAAANSVADGSGGTNYVGTVTGAPSSLAQQTLGQSINIPPSLEFGQGRIVTVFVARDLSFDSVYKLVLR